MLNRLPSQRLQVASGTPPESVQTPPTAHLVVQIGIAEGPKGSALPMLILDEGEVSILVLAWARELMLTDGTKPGTLLQAVSAVGRLYDFYILHKHGKAVDPAGMRKLIREFYEARRSGLPSLAWKRVRAATAWRDVLYVTSFNGFCADNFGHVAMNPVERVAFKSLSLGEQHQELLKYANRRKWDMLFHTVKAPVERSTVERRAMEPPAEVRRKSTGVKHFPIDKVVAFIEGCPRVRDRLYWTLLFFGSVRISEPLHLFVTDVTLDRKTGTARVVLGHPRDGIVDIPDEKTGTVRRMMRAEYLAERYGLAPRDALPTTHPLHAGWKGMSYDDPKRMESYVHWLDNRWGQRFWMWYCEYLAELSPGSSHPYLLRTGQGEGADLPLKYSAARHAFARSAIRVGLQPNDDTGVNPHGARHFYGFMCATLDIPLHTAQRAMHHVSPDSTLIYYHIDNAKVRKAMEEAQMKIASKVGAQLDPPTFPLLADASPFTG